MIWVNYFSFNVAYHSSMYICLCHAVTESAIRKALDEGVRSFQDLSFKTGCGTQCGSCVEQARHTMNETLAQQGDNPAMVKLRLVNSA